MRLGMAEGPKWQREGGGDVKWEDRDNGEIHFSSVCYLCLESQKLSVFFRVGFGFVWIGFLPIMKNMCMYFILKLKRRRKICCLTLGGVIETKG